MRSLFQWQKKTISQKEAVKRYSPVIDEINEIQRKDLCLVSNNELREYSQKFKDEIRRELAKIDLEADEAKRQIKHLENAFSIPDALRMYKELEELQKKRREELQKVLDRLLPRAFAVLKEATRRFKENDFLITQALPGDLKLSERLNKPDFLRIEGNKAIWHTSWMAAGGNINWGMEPYDVQLIGAVALYHGNVIEMANGEGKTLAAIFPAYLYALSEENVHIVTANDYLSRRDSQWMAPVLEFLNMRVDCIDLHRPHAVSRKEAYRADITYGSINEFGFDYLRDNMVRHKEDAVQRGHYYAIIDEADFLLIDEARIPLIISGPKSDSTGIQGYNELKPFVERLVSLQRQLVQNTVVELKSFLQERRHDLAWLYKKLLVVHFGLPDYRPFLKLLNDFNLYSKLDDAKGAYHNPLLWQNEDMDNLLFFLFNPNDRKVTLTGLGESKLSELMNDSEFFELPRIMDQLAELEKTYLPGDKNIFLDKKEEYLNVYKEKAFKIDIINNLIKAYICFEENREYVVQDGQVKIVDEHTGRILEGRRYSDGLHQALEAKEMVMVGELTEQYATISTQWYFRRYYRLAGMTATAETEAAELKDIYNLNVVVVPTNRPIVREDHEDLVYKTTREKFNAIVEEIGGLIRQGRPVLVGTTSVEISEKLSRLLRLHGIEHNVLNAKYHQYEAAVIAEAGKPGKVTIATNMAGRGTDIKISNVVRRAGGLAIIGTERHDSRRIDRQLRGRSGRQGDPGSSQFFVSLEDNLMRLFQSERIANLMDQMGHEEGEAIQHSMVTKSIERAQKKVEENNYEKRKRLYEYDSLLNTHREYIYKKRKDVLNEVKLPLDILNIFYDTCELVVKSHTNDYEKFRTHVAFQFGVETTISQSDHNKLSQPELTTKLYQEVYNEHYLTKMERVIKVLFPHIFSIYNNPDQSHYKKILVPFSQPGNSGKAIPITVEIAKAVDTNGSHIRLGIEKATLLDIIDKMWRQHLHEMEELKDSLNNTSGQVQKQDPLLQYNLEGFDLFERLILRINEEVTSYLSKGTLVFGDGRTLEEMDEGKPFHRRSRFADGESPSYPVERRVGRNDPCPCGSGKKYKHCHGMVETGGEEEE